MNEDARGADGLPKFSVVIPTYHRNDLLALCLERLAPTVQTLATERYEVIVTDDGTKTTAAEMVRARFPWARWVEGPHRGPAANRNYGAKQVRGEWIVFTDDDCLPAPGWLAAYDGTIEPDTTAYEGRTACEQRIRTLVEETPVNDAPGTLWSCNMMIAPATFESVGGFDETFPFAYFEDVDFRERLKHAGYAFTFVPDALVYHPPRPRRFGVKAGQVQESTVLIWYKGGNDEPVARRLIWFLLQQRLHEIRQSPFSLDVPKAVSSLIGEIVYVAAHAREWEKKYRQRYRNSEPAYQYRVI